MPETDATQDCRCVNRSTPPPAYISREGGHKRKTLINSAPAPIKSRPLLPYPASEFTAFAP